MTELDRVRVESLTDEIMQLIIANYRRGPMERVRVFEALNALSFVAATVISAAGTADGRARARAFFDRGLADQLAELVGSLPVVQ